MMLICLICVQFPYVHNKNANIYICYMIYIAQASELRFLRDCVT